VCILVSVCVRTGECECILVSVCVRTGECECILVSVCVCILVNMRVCLRSDIFLRCAIPLRLYVREIWGAVYTYAVVCAREVWVLST